MRATIPCTLVLLLLAAPPAANAGTLRLEFRDGYVSISAVSVPLQQVLTEWARLGQTRVVNAEKLGGAPLTLELTHVPETQALDTLLRSVPGYLAARRATFVAGGSQFDRIVVMPGTVAPPSPSVAAPPPPLPPAPMPAIAVEDQDDPVPQEAPDQAGAAEQEQDPDQPQPQQPQTLPNPGVQPIPPAPQGQDDGEGVPPQQPQTLPNPGVQPIPPAPQRQNDGDGVPPQQPAGPVQVPGGGAVVSPTPGQLPLPPAKPPNQ
jgi:hypothetical protein